MTTYSREVIQGMAANRYHWVLNQLVRLLNDDLTLQAVSVDESNEVVRRFIYDYNDGLFGETVEMKRYVYNPNFLERDLGVTRKTALIGIVNKSKTLLVSFQGAVAFFENELKQFFNRTQK